MGTTQAASLPATAAGAPPDIPAPDEGDAGSALPIATGTGTDITCDIFCRVIDNYGDIGVCWRLARQLSRAPHAWRIRLWVDDLSRCQALVPDIDPHRPLQHHDDITLVRWQDSPPALEPGDVVIEAFACDPPADFIARMTRKTLWINLEYLSAESWVEGCHLLPSPQPGGHVKHFFFPGFTTATGGLLREPGLLAQRDAWLADPAQRHALWRDLGLPADAIASLRQGALQVFLFCYPHAPVAALLQGLAASGRPAVVLAAPGMVNAASRELVRGTQVHVCDIPFVAQHAFDPLLWSSDLNCVRGEDSVIRALWAARPLLWHIYPQDEDAHLQKLDAWLARAPYPGRVAALMRGWNAAAQACGKGGDKTGGNDMGSDASRNGKRIILNAVPTSSDDGSASPPDLDARSGAALSDLLAASLAPEAFAAWQDSAAQWSAQLAAQADLASSLQGFCAKSLQNG